MTKQEFEQYVVSGFDSEKNKKILTVLNRLLLKNITNGYLDFLRK